MKMHKAPAIHGIVFFITGIIVSNYTYCNGQVSVFGSVIGGCYANTFFIPYGLGLMVLGACFIGFSLLTNVREKSSPIELQQTVSSS